MSRLEGATHWKLIAGVQAVEIEGILSRSPCQNAPSPLSHQNPRRGSSGPHIHLGAHTYHLAEDGWAPGLIVLPGLYTEGEKGYPEGKPGGCYHHKVVKSRSLSGYDPWACRSESQ